MITFEIENIYIDDISCQYNVQDVGKNLKVKLSYLNITDPRNSAKFLKRIQPMVSPKSKKSN
jgi:hypothetical protein